MVMTCSCQKGDGKKGKIETHYEELSSVGDDVWADEDINIENKTADIQRTHKKQGYIDGITSKRESQLQKGFDELFPKGAEFGTAVGYILGTLNAKHEIQLSRQCKEELNIQNLFNEQYFDMEIELRNGKEHELIQKWKEKVSRLNRDA